MSKILQTVMNAGRDNFPFLQPRAGDTPHLLASKAATQAILPTLWRLSDFTSLGFEFGFSVSGNGIGILTNLQVQSMRCPVLKTAMWSPVKYPSDPLSS